MLSPKTKPASTLGGPRNFDRLGGAICKTDNPVRGKTQHRVAHALDDSDHQAPVGGHSKEPRFVPPGQIAMGTASPAPCWSISPHVAEYLDNYHRVVATLNSRWRVIQCHDDIQWVLQQRVGDIWRGRRFHRNRDALIKISVKKLCGDVDGDALAMLRDLPEWFECSGEKS